jgi:hypothetical protein
MKNQLLAFNLGDLRGIGPLGLEGELGEAAVKGAAPSRFNLFISGAIGLMTVVAMIWFTINFILGAIGLMTSGGDKGKLETAKNKITTGLIGLVVVIAAIFIIQFFGSLLGIGSIILRPTDIINLIAP